MTTTNLIATVKAECKLTVLAHLKGQMRGDEPADLTQVLTQRLEAVFEMHLANPIRQAVDAALASTIHNAVDGSLLATLDRVLDQAVDSAIGSAVESLAGDLTSTDDEALLEEEPDVLVMADAARITSPAEGLATLDTRISSRASDFPGRAVEVPFGAMPAAEPAPETTLEAQPLPAEETQPVTEDAGAPDHNADSSDAGDTSEISADLADAIRRLNAEGRSVRSISRTLKVRELVGRFVTGAGASNG
jgi:hypothetical protein